MVSLVFKILIIMNTLNALKFLFRYLHPPDHNSIRIIKANKHFANKLDFKDINFQVKLEVFTKFLKKEFYCL